MRKERPSVGSLSMQNYPNKSAGTVFINPAPPVPAPPVNIEAPLLSGTGAVESTVTCSSGVWTGSPTPTYTYDFRLDSVSVQNSASNSYTPLLADDGKTLTCLVTATNSQGTASEGTSNSVVIGVAPSNTVAPTLSPSGTQSTGTVITVGNGTFAGTAPLTYAYRWKRNGSIILGETNNTYTLVAGDDGTVITAEVKASNAYGESAYIGTSNQVDAVNAVAPVNTAAPVISGSTSLGSILSTTNGTWSGVPATFSYTYQWKRNGSPIGGATSSTYTTVVADSLANITCDVTADNGVPPTATAGSNTLTMANYTPANTAAPAVTGTAVVGQTLSTTNGSWTNSPSSFSYQWYRGATLISGATNSTYALVSADAGQNIKCTVTATNSAGSASADSTTVAILATLLDIYPNAAAAYSVRLLRGAHYTSSAIRVRRSNDNAEQDIGFTTSGDLNTSALTTFVGANSGFIVTWYDQSGNARNISQTTPTGQPRIVNAGIIDATLSKPITIFDGVDDVLEHVVTLSQPVSIFTAGVAPTLPIGATAFRSVVSFPNSAGTDAGLAIELNTNLTKKTLLYSGAIIGDATSRSGNMIVSGISNGATSSLHINSTLIASGNAGASNIGRIRLGRNWSVASFYNNRHFEVILYQASQSANRAAIESNMNNYYGIF